MAQFIGEWCSKHTCPARITTQGEELLQQTNGHKHAVDETNSRVEQIRCNLRKRAREEVVPIPPIYNDVLIELSTQHDHPLHLHYITLVPTQPTWKLPWLSCFRHSGTWAQVFGHYGIRPLGIGLYGNNSKNDCVTRGINHVCINAFCVNKCLGAR